MEAVPVTIRAAAEAKGWNLEQLALASGTNYPYVARMARGLQDLSEEYAERLAPALGVTPAALLAGQAALIEEKRAQLLADEPMEAVPA